VMFRVHRNAALAIRCALLMLAAGSIVSAQRTTLVTGLKNPTKIIAGPRGTILVTEFDATPNSGRISVVDSSGARRTLVDGLPSGTSLPELAPDGPNGLALADRTLYVANGEGDTLRNGSVPRSTVPNPAGPSSPIFSTILKVEFSVDIDRLAAGFSLTAANQNTLADHNPVTLTNTAGERAVIAVLSEFRPARPDPLTVYRNTHLYGLALMASQPNSLYAVDAGNNAIWQIDLDSGRNRLLTRFPPSPNPAFVSPPVSEAVPDSIFASGNRLLVTLLSGFPFVRSASRVMDVDPATGRFTPLITQLNSAIDVAQPAQSGPYYVLEFSAAFSAAPPLPGRFLVYEPSGNVRVLADDLITPTSMLIDETAGTAYVSSRALGNIVAIKLR
jgi:hypothetical protein